MKTINESRLLYLYEASRIGSMRAASEALNVAPSSISRQIALLEQELGVALLERGRRSIKLTEAGEAAVAYFRERRSRQEAFLSRVHGLSGLTEGRIVLAVGEGMVGNPLFEILTTFMEEHPGIRIATRVVGTNEVLGLVIDDEAHIGMVFQCPPHPKIRVRAASEQPMNVLFRPTHRFMKAGSVTLDELVNERIALPERSFRIRQVLEEVEQERGVFLTPSLTSNSLLLLKEFAQSGAGVTILPAIAAYGEIQSGTLMARPIDDVILTRTGVHVVTRLGRQLPLAAARLLQRIEACMPRIAVPYKSLPK